jgi:hypothetical protein
MTGKPRSLLFSLVVIVIFALCFSTYMVKANSAGEDQQIKQVINQYFKARYNSFKTLQLGDFSTLTINTSQDSEMQKEFDKLDLEIYHADVFQLRYQSYQYYLDFRNIDIDPTTGKATVDMIEGCDVVFEISAPSISKMRNQKHTLHLQKENGGMENYSR